jgi:hypothetical protein
MARLLALTLHCSRGVTTHCVMVKLHGQIHDILQMRASAQQLHHCNLSI